MSAARVAEQVRRVSGEGLFTDQRHMAKKGTGPHRLPHPHAHGIVIADLTTSASAG